MMVLIPKADGGDFWGVVFVEFLCNNMTWILNRRFASAIQFHGFFYGFQEGNGMGTATPEANLIKQLTVMR